MSQAGGGDHMKYIKGNTQSFITRLLQQLSAISTAPGAMFPLQEEHLGVPSLESALMRWQFHRISSSRA